MTEKNNKNILYCSFCGKSQHEVRKLIAGPTVFICDECVELCMDIIKEESKDTFVKHQDGLPPPKEICSVSRKAQAIDLMSLNEIAYIVRNANFCICSDTGLAHLSALTGTPSVTLYGPTKTSLIGTTGINQNHLIGDKEDIKYNSNDEPFMTRYHFTNNALPNKKGDHYFLLSLFGPEVHFGMTENLRERFYIKRKPPTPATHCLPLLAYYL